MSLEFLDIADVNDSDEVLVVEFKCECGYSFGFVPIEDDGISSGKTREIGEKLCERCGLYSDFSYMPAYAAKAGVAATAIPPRQEFSRRKSNQENLCDLLARNLNNPAKEKRMLIQELLKGRRLKLRFGVERTSKPTILSA
jgi:hypothetical protein